MIVFFSILLFFLNTLTFQGNKPQNFTEKSNYPSAINNYLDNDTNSPVDDDDLNFDFGSDIQDSNLPDVYLIDCSNYYVQESASFFNPYLNPLQLDIPPPYCS
jgi:hypothetical protein